MKNAKVLYVSSEIMPYLPESEISRISRQLPQGILEKGKEVRTFMPKFGAVNERRNQLHEVIRLSGQNLIIADTDHPLLLKVASIQQARMQVYFIDNEDYFHRKGTELALDGKEYADNDERSIFFARGVLETTKKLRWSPDLIHCHGWFTSFVPLFVRAMSKVDTYFAGSKIVISIYDKEFTTIWDGEIQKKLFVEDIDEEITSKVNVNDYISLMKMAIDLSDGVIQASDTISQELIDYAKQSGKPFLEYQSEDVYVDSFNEFYDKVLG